MEFQFSRDRQSVRITGAEGEDEASVFTSLIAANVRNILDDTKSAERAKDYHRIFADDFPELTEAVTVEKLRALRGRLRSKVNLVVFVNVGMERIGEHIEIPEGQSPEQVVQRDVKKTLAVEAAKDGVFVLPTAQQVADAMTPTDPQLQARGLAFQLINRAVVGRL